MRLRRQFQIVLDTTGAGHIDISPNNAAMEWKVFQVSVITTTLTPGCMAAIVHNGAYLHSTPNGSLDSATGPPYLIINSSDVLSVYWSSGKAGDQATATLWYEEFPSGTSAAT